MSLSAMAHVVGWRSIERWRWRAAPYVERLRLPGIVGVLLLLASAWVVLVDIPAAQRQIGQLQRANALAAPQAAADRVAAAPETGSLPNLKLPSVTSANRVAPELMIVLRNAGVGVTEISAAEGSAATHADRDGGVRYTDLTVSAAGPYPAIRNGLDAVLQTHPTLALTYLSLNNEAPRASTKAVVQAQIRMRFFYSATP